MNYLSICSGIEAASVAWHPLSWQPVAFSEIEPFPAEVLNQRFPDVPNLGDMTKYKRWPAELLAEVDLVVGGTPCQAFSVAGKRNSLDDDRGNLSLVFIHLIDHIDEIRRSHGKPAVIIVWENVPGVLTTKDNAFGCVLSGLSGTDVTAVERWKKAGRVHGERRRVAWCVLDAQFFGVAQRRRRVFAVAVPNPSIGGLDTWPCPSEILSIGTCLRGDTPSREQAGKETAADAAQGTRVGSQWTGEDCHPTLNKPNGSPGYSDQELFSQKGANLVKAYRVCSYASNSMKSSNPHSGCPDVTDETSPTLDNNGGNPACNQGGTAIAIQGNLVGRVKGGTGGVGAKEDGTAYTLNSTDQQCVAACIPEVCGTLSDGAHNGGGLTDRTPTPAESSRAYRMTAFGEYADDQTASAIKRRDYKNATDLVIE